MVYPISKYVFYPLLRIFIKEIEGINNLPKNKPFIVVANHTSYIDAVLLIFLIAWYLNKKIHFFLIKNMFTNFFFVLIFEKWFGSIRVNGSVKKAIDYAKKGCLLGIFPEAGRTTTGFLQKVTHSGLGIIALSTKNPIIPIGLTGTYKFWPPHNSVPNFKRIIKIKIGKPMLFKKNVSKKNAKLVVANVMKKLGKLIHQKYNY